MVTQQLSLGIPLTPSQQDVQMALANLKELQSPGLANAVRFLRGSLGPLWHLGWLFRSTWKSLISHVSESRRKGKLLLSVGSLGALPMCSEHIKSVLCSSLCSRPTAMRSQRFRWTFQEIGKSPWYRTEHSKINSSQNAVLRAQGITRTEKQLKSSAHPSAAERFLKARNSPSLVNNGVRYGIEHGRHLFRNWRCY